MTPVNANDPYELLIQQMISIERQPQLAIKAQKSEAEVFKGVLSDFDSKLSALHTQMKSFTDLLASPFEARRSVGGDTDSFGVSVSDSAAYGTHSIQVERLASTDTRISKQMTKAGSELSNFFTTNGAQTFTISVASPTDLDPDNREDISVMVDPVGTTDEEILKEIATAVNDAMFSARDAGTIKGVEESSASVISETSTTSRLSLRSGQTGFANRLEFTDSANGLLSLLEVNNAAVASGTSGGQVVDVGTSETDSALNSRFLLDGLTMYRSTNQVSDALDGITLSLKQVATSSTDFIVEPDAESIEGQIKDFITNYNDVISYIQGKGMVDGDLGTRGPFAGDSTFTGLRFNMRNDIATQVSGQPFDAPSYLTEIGIEIEDDGTLKLSDSDALLAAIEGDSASVQSLFDGTDGIATRLIDRLDRFLGIDGIIDNREEVIDDRIKRLEDNIDRWDDRMSIREDQLRGQFARFQEQIAILQGQQQTVSSFFFSQGFY